MWIIKSVVKGIITSGKEFIIYLTKKQSVNIQFAMEATKN